MVTMKRRDVVKGHVAAVGKYLQKLIVRIDERPYGTARTMFAGTNERSTKIVRKVVA